MIYSFGSGQLIGRRNDVTPAVPISFGLLQNVTFDFSFTVKELYGTYQFPVAIGRGTAKLTGKAVVANLSGIAFNALFFGQSLATGQVSMAFNESGTIPTTPFTVTVANGANFRADYGVLYALTGLPLTRVTSAPATGQYSVNETTGVYTFAAADTGLGVLITYTYAIAGTGSQIVLTNPLLGVVPTFSMAFRTVYQSKQATLVFNNCTSSKLSIATKLEDFVMPEFDFSILADASNTIGTLSFSEAS